MTKMTKCHVCGKDLAANAKACPECGAKQKKPLWKKWWVWLIAAVVIIGVANSSTDSNSKNTTVSTEQQSEESIVYEEYTAAQLVDDLTSNALAAEEKYLDKYVKISGRLRNIDSDGSYISIEPSNNEFNLVSIQCYLKNDEHKSIVMGLKKDDIVSVKGKITDIGEILGYKLDVIEFAQ